MLRRTRRHESPCPPDPSGAVTPPPPLDAGSAIFLDVDGTLLEIAPRPELVRVPPELPQMLEQLACQRNGALALISGRTLADLDWLFQPWHGAAAGGHGAERRRIDGSIVAEQHTEADRIAAAALDRMRPKLATLSDRWPGAWIEDKGRTLALHYRAIPEREREIRRAATQLAQRESEALRLIAGKMVLELQPGHRHKGAVIAAFLTEAPFRGRQPLFVGDDATDEDGFAEVNRRGGVSVRVGPRTSDSVAGYYLPSVTDVLNWLVAAAEG
jgi:trehalose 6-phosphate phosphatase